MDRLAQAYERSEQQRLDAIEEAARARNALHAERSAWTQRHAREHDMHQAELEALQALHKEDQARERSRTKEVLRGAIGCDRANPSNSSPSSKLYALRSADLLLGDEALEAEIQALAGRNPHSEATQHSFEATHSPLPVLDSSKRAQDLRHRATSPLLNASASSSVLAGQDALLQTAKSRSSATKRRSDRGVSTGVEPFTRFRNWIESERARNSPGLGLGSPSPSIGKSRSSGSRRSQASIGANQASASSLASHRRRSPAIARRRACLLYTSPSPRDS